jgi:multidrug efflux pump subunit AcrA (membrane-fusion protein)
MQAEKAQLEQQLEDMIETEQLDASLQQQQQQMQQRLQYDQLQLQIAQQSQLILTLQLQLQQRAHVPVVEIQPTEPDIVQAAPVSAPAVSSPFSTPVSSPKRSPLRRSTPTVHSPPPPPRQPRSATELWRVARCYVHTRACLTRALATLHADFVDEVAQETAERCRVRGALSAFEAFDEIRSTSTGILLFFFPISSC